MPIKSFADIDNMIAAYKRSNAPQVKNHSTLASGYWITSTSSQEPFEGSYSRTSSSSSSYGTSMSRSTRVIGAADMVDENGYFNSSRQLLK